MNLLLIGNKSDLEEEREVEYNEGAEFGKHFYLFWEDYVIIGKYENLRFIETSAKDATNVQLAFESIALDIMAW